LTEDTRPQPVVKCAGITKFFGGVQALARVSVSLHQSEVVGLVGENGAGKSTLTKILSGLLRPDQGEIWFGDEPVRNLTAQACRAAGIETVYQTLELCDALDAPANVFLGQEPIRFAIGPFRFIDERRAEVETRAKLKELGIQISDLRSTVRRLSGGQRQALAVARATIKGHRLIILDEPTAALGVRQKKVILDLIREVARRGVAVLLISHNIDEIMTVADRIVALRLGHLVMDVRRDATNRREVEEAMSGLRQVALS
jgi:simple sugar transport system ATP-binding protein